VRTLAERMLELSGGRLALAIIGSSHFLEIRGARTTLCELLSCSNPELREQLAQSEALGKGERWSCRVRREDVSYRFECRRRRYAARDYELEAARLLVDRADRLRYSFPQKEPARSALTCLEWRVDGRRATVATHHTFPEELVIVHTRSVVNFAEAGALP